MGAGLNKVRNRIRYINRVTYNEYKNKYPSTSIDYTAFINILKQSNKRIGEYVLSNELGFKFPYNLGYFAVTKFRQKEKYNVIDWHNTHKFNKLIPQMNLHSFGYMFKMEFFKNRRMKALLAYKGTAHRTLKRELAKRIKAGHQNYLKLDNSYFNKRFAIGRIFKPYKSTQNG